MCKVVWLYYALPIRRISEVCRSAGPYGGGGGEAFTELYDNCNANVSKIFIRSGSRIDGIELTYRISDGHEITGGYHGGTGGSPHEFTIDVPGGERVIGVFGRSGSNVDNLGFITNWGRIFGPHGGCGGGPFTVNSCNVKGISGRSGDRLDNIGLFCGSV